MVLSHAERDSITAAIRQAEMSTTAEIVCVVARMSSDYAALPYLWSSLISLVIPWPMVFATDLSVQQILATQLGVFALSFLVLSMERFRIAMAPRAMRRVEAHRTALEQFMNRRMSRTHNSNGVLIFVSLGERYVRIVADDRVNERITRADWQEVINTLIAEVHKGRLAEGLVAAIERSGLLLARHFPDEGEHRNELPDRVYLI